MKTHTIKTTIAYQQLQIGSLASKIADHNSVQLQLEHHRQTNYNLENANNQQSSALQGLKQQIQGY